MDFGGFLMLALFGATVGGTLIAKLVGAFPTDDTILQLPVERMARAQRVTLGQARPAVDLLVSGHLAPGDDAPPLLAPLSGRPCLAWQVRVYSPGLASRGKTSWRQHFSDESGNCVRLHDQSGRASVQLAGALWVLAVHTTELRYDDDLTDRSRAFLERNHFTWSGYDKPHLRLDEQIVTDGQAVAIFGRVAGSSARPAGDDPYRDGSPDPVLAAWPDCPLILTPPA